MSPHRQTQVFSGAAFKAAAVLLLASLFGGTPAGLRAADFDGNIVLGSPTNTAITANVLTANSQDIYLSYGTESGAYSARTPTIGFSAGKPQEILLAGLQPNTRYFYQLSYNEGADDFLSTAEFSFHTPREAGSSFVFGVQGDSHPERAPRDFIAELYTRTLAQAAKDGVDFYVTTGDDFSIDLNYPNGITQDDVAERYRIQRPWFGVVGNSAPVFLVPGNHEQAALYLYENASKYPAPENPAVWAQNARNQYYSQPSPNEFYSGNDRSLKYIDKGLKGTYFAWQWGDALFVTLDPFWTSPKAVDNIFEGERGKKTENKWDITLGDEQYHWLAKTLEQSDAAFKFIFAHLIHGGDRGGVEQANIYEWGGESRNGSYEFDTKRPDWDKPIHQLMVDNNVTVFFHAHDHVWVKQELDGVIYQELGSPADADYELSNWATAYTDASSVVLPNTGYTRISVTPDNVRVDYVRSYLPQNENDDRATGDVAYSYTIDKTRKQVTPQ